MEIRSMEVRIKPPECKELVDRANEEMPHDISKGIADREIRTVQGRTIHFCKISSHTGEVTTLRHTNIAMGETINNHKGGNNIFRTKVKPIMEICNQASSF